MAASHSSMAASHKTLKFLYSYGGKIVPRSIDGKLRYVAGHNRILTVDRSITFSELMVRFKESCGSSMDLKCKLPNEDFDLLVSVKSDEDLRNVIEEYQRVSPEAQIRAVLFPAISSSKKTSPPPSPISCLDFPSVLQPKPKPKPKPKNLPRAASLYASPPYAAIAHRYLPPAAVKSAERCRRYGPRSRMHFH